METRVNNVAFTIRLVQPELKNQKYNGIQFPVSEPWDRTE